MSEKPNKNTMFTDIMEMFQGPEKPDKAQVEAIKEEATKGRKTVLASIASRLFGTGEPGSSQTLETSWFGNEENGKIYNTLDSALGRISPNANMFWDVIQFFDQKFLGDMIPGKINKFEGYTAIAGLTLKYFGKSGEAVLNTFGLDKVTGLMQPLLKTFGFVFETKLAKMYPGIDELAKKGADGDVLAMIEILRILSKDMTILIQDPLLGAALGGITKLID